ncbi:MAG: DUF952 domain-containing protein [Thermotogota bacterium]|nr:DUF952 domain-containing protein [Thermotogota bacterium]
MILHIIRNQEWQLAKQSGSYKNKSLEEEGFAHCSNEDQVCKVANTLYKDEEDILLLYIDEKKLVSKIVYEDLYQLGEKYPHVYGPINLDVVVKTEPFLKDENGAFHLKAY